MKIKTKKKCDRLIRDIESLKKEGVELELQHGRYSLELTLVDNNAISPSDYVVAVLKTGM